VAERPVNGKPTDGTPSEIRVPRQTCGEAYGEIRVPRESHQASGESHGEIPMPYQLRGEHSAEFRVSYQVRDERRGEVVLRHARLTGRGRPTFCSPTRAEQAGILSLKTGSGTDGKVIYPTREAAEAAARELESLGARRLRPYLCARSRHGHFHLATDTSRPLHERIPQQRRPA
jgi:hypothetical protein